MPVIEITKDVMGFQKGQTFAISENQRAYGLVQQAIADGKAKVVTETEKEKKDKDKDK